MTILNCECGNEIFIMDETEATAWQCEQCGLAVSLSSEKDRKSAGGS